MLVPGQVADDLSVRLGGGAIHVQPGRCCKAVRAALPEALHPVQAASLTWTPATAKAPIPDAQALEIADTASSAGVPMAPLDWQAVHEVHTLTSLDRV